MDLADYLHRVLQINALTQKRGHFPALLSEVFNLLYERVLETGQHVVWTKIADVATSYRLAEWSRITTDAEKLISEAGHEDYPEAVKLICEIAVRGFDALKEPERKKICQAALTDQTLKMREQAQGASAKAYWTRKAIGELRAAGGFRDRVKELLRELRELQVEALDEHGQLSVPLDLEDERSGTIEFFKGLTLPDILREFAVYTLPPQKPSFTDKLMKIIIVLSSLHFSARPTLTVKVKPMRKRRPLQPRMKPAMSGLNQSLCAF